MDKVWPLWYIIPAMVFVFKSMALFEQAGRADGDSSEGSTEGDQRAL